MYYLALKLKSFTIGKFYWDSLEKEISPERNFINFMLSHNSISLLAVSLISLTKKVLFVMTIRDR